MFRSTNVPFDQCSVRPMFHSTNVPFDQCSVRPMFHLTNVLDQCSIRPMFLRRKCIRRKCLRQKQLNPFPGIPREYYQIFPNLTWNSWRYISEIPGNFYTFQGFPELSERVRDSGEYLVLQVRYNIYMINFSLFNRL